MEDNGYSFQVKDVENLGAIKEQYQVPFALQSCHTAIVDGYVVEGHVPVADVERLLRERPAILGIAVAGMPVNSPGMEMPGAASEPFDVIAFSADGTQTIFASYRP